MERILVTNTPRRVLSAPAAALNSTTTPHPPSPPPLPPPSPHYVIVVEQSRHIIIVKNTLRRRNADYASSCYCASRIFPLHRRNCHCNYRRPALRLFATTTTTHCSDTTHSAVVEVTQAMTPRDASAAFSPSPPSFSHEGPNPPRTRGTELTRWRHHHHYHYWCGRRCLSERTQ